MIISLSRLFWCLLCELDFNLSMICTKISTNLQYFTRIDSGWKVVHVLFMLFVFIYVSRYPSRLSYQMMFVSFNSTTTGPTGGTGTTNRHCNITVSFTKLVFKFGQTWPSITLISFYDLHEFRALPHATDLKNIPMGVIRAWRYHRGNQSLKIPQG
jgi:hypothetical protein